MKVVGIADTHGLHEQLTVPDGDLLVHAGDFTEAGSRQDEESFLQWLEQQPHEHKAVILGNHEGGFDRQRRARFEWDCEQRGILPLHNDRRTIKGVVFQFLGFPAPTPRPTPDFYDEITDEVDVLVSHAPPRGILDRDVSGKHRGNRPVAKRLKQADISVHLFGHVHRSYGVKNQEGTKFINAALKHDYNLDQPITFTIEGEGQ